MIYYDFDPNNYTMQNFNHIFQNFGVPQKVVEIGVYAGKTTFQLASFITPRLKDLEYHAVDPYSTSLDVLENLDDMHNFFISQLNDFPFKQNITFHREKSSDVLAKLKTLNFRPQLIYIDGDHTASTVLTDLVLSFEILDKGGVIICDDCVSWRYTDKNGYADPQMSPKMAVDSFLMCNWSKVKVLDLPINLQMAFIKL